MIRHGESDYSIDSLTEKGRFEAELLLRRLLKEPIDEFYCSPFGRAWDPATSTLQKLNVDAQIYEFFFKIQSPYTNKNRISWDFPPALWANNTNYYDPEKWLEQQLMQMGNVHEVYHQTIEGVDEQPSLSGLYPVLEY